MEGMTPANPAECIPDEPAFVRRLKSGDEAAFELCVRAFCGRLLPVARRILRNDDDANDAVQDAFVSAFRNLTGFEGRSSLGTWLHGIVVNAALQRLRSRQRRPEVSIEALLPHFGEDDHALDPPAAWPEESRLQTEEVRALVRERIDQLPESYRIVLLLRDIEGLDTEETARALEVSEAVVKTRLHRARQALRTLLDSDIRRGDL